MRNWSVSFVFASETARSAQIGEGALYLYWHTTEDLIAELVARDFLDTVAEYVSGLAVGAPASMPVEGSARAGLRVRTTRGPVRNSAGR